MKKSSLATSGGLGNVPDLGPNYTICTASCVRKWTLFPVINSQVMKANMTANPLWKSSVANLKEAQGFSLVGAVPVSPLTCFFLKLHFLFS